MLQLLAMAAAWQTPVRPNIVLIFSDDHARQAISAYGSELARTPGIDRLAAEGTVFLRHYTANPICAPSRATLWTGLHSHLNGHRDNASTFDGGQRTFPKLLQAAGYETAAIGKWHLVSEPTGFDHWEVLPGQGAYYNPDFLTQGGKVQVNGYTTEIITRKALDWIGKSREKPFFLFVGHKAPHRNWAPGPSEMDYLNNVRFPEPKTLRTDYSGLCSAAKSVRMRLDRDIRVREDLHVGLRPARMDEEQASLWDRAFKTQDEAYNRQREASGDLLGANYQRYLANYLRSAAAVDKSVGQILESLRAKGQLENTVVIYTSDQGFFLGENGWYDKRWFYEPSAGTPLIIRDSQRDRQVGKVSRLTSNVDLAPTILEFAGLPRPADMQGESLLPAMRGRRKLEPERPAYGHFYESDDADHKAPKYVAICTQRYKLIFYYELKEWELFDLEADPNETRNLWLDSARRVDRAEMTRKLVLKMREVKEDAGLTRLAEMHANGPR